MTQQRASVTRATCDPNATDAIKAQTAIDPNKIMASDPASENKNTDDNAQGRGPEPAEDDHATTMVDESTQA